MYLFKYTSLFSGSLGVGGALKVDPTKNSSTDDGRMMKDFTILLISDLDPIVLVLLVLSFFLDSGS